jgi:hypothetical protein
MSDIVEKWLPVVGWEGLYEVSNLGGVRSLGRANPISYGQRLKPFLSGVATRYWQVRLYNAHGTKDRKVHHLVLEAFHGPRPEGYECRHLNGVATDNAEWNLAWGTHVENMADKRKHGTARRRLTDEQVRSIRRDQRKQGAIAAEYGMSQSVISMIRTKKRYAYVEEV